MRVTVPLNIKNVKIADIFLTCYDCSLLEIAVPGLLEMGLKLTLGENTLLKRVQ